MSSAWETQQDFRKSTNYKKDPLTENLKGKRQSDIEQDMPNHYVKVPNPKLRGSV